jgi:hypothetical protein
MSNEEEYASSTGILVTLVDFSTYKLPSRAQHRFEKRRRSKFECRIWRKKRKVKVTIIRSAEQFEKLYGP